MKLATYLMLGLVSFFAPGCIERQGPTASESKSGWVDRGEAKLYYEDQGEGLPLILIHGGLLDSSMWDPQFEVFSRKYRVVRYDVRGHGKSPGVPGEFSHFDDLRELMDQLNLDQAALLGLSLGGRIAIDFAIAYPERVSALVLASPGLSGYAFRSETVVESNEKMTRALAEDDVIEAVEYFLRTWTDGPRRAPSDMNPLIREKVRLMAMNTMENWKGGGRARELEPPAVGRLNEIRAPSLVVVGELDVSDILDIAGRLEAEVEGARVVLLPGAAHMVNLEKPQELNELVIDFLDEVLQRESTSG